jgi:hypothetical protein
VFDSGEPRTLGAINKDGQRTIEDLGQVAIWNLMPHEAASLFEFAMSVFTYSDPNEVASR